MVSFTHEQNIIFNHTQLNDIEHEQTIICLQLFAGHVVGSRPMKRKKKFASNDHNIRIECNEIRDKLQRQISTARSCMPLNMIQRETER